MSDLDGQSRVPARTKPGFRVFYAAGPGDVVGTFRHWKQGRDDPGQMSVTWSGQFFDVCRDMGVEACVVSSHGRLDHEADGQFTVLHRPKSSWGQLGGWRYHAAEQWYALRTIAGAVRFRADLVLLTGGGSLLLFSLLRLLRIQLVPDFACVLWPKYVAFGRLRRLLQRLDRSVLRSQATAILSMSCDITKQVTQASGGQSRPVLEYLPLYRVGRVSRLPAPAGRPFRVVFSGRVEAYKGAFVLVELARRFKNQGKDILIEVCGEGGALGEVQKAVSSQDLGSHLVLHGYCMSGKLSEIYARSHAVIVPTTSSFMEGFNQVVAEAVLFGRPVITSEVCPAVHYLGDAVVRVAVDDLDGYLEAVERLADEPGYYALKHAAGTLVREQFFDARNSFGAALRITLEAARARQVPSPRSVAVSRATR